MSKLRYSVKNRKFFFQFVPPAVIKLNFESKAGKNKIWRQ